MTGNYHIQANFMSLLDSLYVDAHAPDDPEPNDMTVSDPQEDGTPEHPFDSIQEALEVARPGGEVVVNGGLYPERIDFTGKAVVVRGSWLTDPNRRGEPVVSGNGVGPVVTFGRGADSVLSGFRIQGGRAWTGAAILCTRAEATLANCLIVGHVVERAHGGVIDCHDSNAVFVNCTIQGNISKIGVQDAAVFSGSAGQVRVSNSIIWGNTPLTLTSMAGSIFEIAYCAIEGGWPGTGNCALDPLFAELGYWNNAGTPSSQGDDFWVSGDYHLLSQTGRWDPVAQTWLADTQSSPCIDAGDPNVPGGQEPLPNGGRINLGAYGGTNQASKSPGGG